MRYLVLAFLLFFDTVAFARAPRDSSVDNGDALGNQPFLREYAWGVRRLPLDGGRIYGWRINDNVTFGRFKGENDEFGFSVEMDSRQRVEITTDGLRWRRAIGGKP